ncbi:hypothetical protein [Streptomyces rishiriensis]|uniref:Uncharacterized protein n=1 Tax=Streptomyces rishiriensis TaxID=68264 RepID=A0ABU0P0B3_STRRH|nr:hypothetical protein [Streptomyces rishiriensis]MDQ0584140.1 hypothetical protein [Streptomyces rishiriensis]
MTVRRPWNGVGEKLAGHGEPRIGVEPAELLAAAGAGHEPPTTVRQAVLGDQWLSWEPSMK